MIICTCTIRRRRAFSGIQCIVTSSSIYGSIISGSSTESVSTALTLYRYRSPMVIGYDARYSLRACVLSYSNALYSNFQYPSISTTVVACKVGVLGTIRVIATAPCRTNSESYGFTWLIQKPFGYYWTGTYPTGGPAVGTYLDPTNSNTFRLYVNGALLNFGTWSKWKIESFQFSYQQGKTLIFSEITGDYTQNPPVLSSYGNHTFSHEQVVFWDVNYGNGWRRVFSGKIREIEAIGENNNEGVRYTVHGIQLLANDIMIREITDWGNGVFYTYPEIALSAQTQVVASFNRYYGLEVVQCPVLTYQPVKVWVAVLYLFELMAPTLQAYGISSFVDISGLNPVTAIPRDLTVSGSFSNVLQQLCNYEPGVRCFYDDVDGIWKFIQIFQTPILLAEIQKNNIMNHTYTSRTDNRYTAVTLVERPDFSNKQSDIQPDDAGKDSEKEHFVSYKLFPGWKQSDEQKWTTQNAQPLLFLNGTFDTRKNPYQYVYRLWFLLEEPPEAEGLTAKLMYNIPPYGPNDTQEHAAEIYLKPDPAPSYGQLTYNNSNNGIIQPINLRSYTLYGYVLTDTPVIIEGNPAVPGDAIGPNLGDMALVCEWTPKAAEKDNTQNENTSAGDAGSIFSPGNTFLNASVAIYRWPAVGFVGQSYVLYGITNEYYEMVDFSEVTPWNAYLKWAALSCVNASGTLPIYGDPIPEMFQMGFRFLLVDEYEVTGLENIPLIITDFTYNFANGGLNNISYTTDISAFLQVK